MWGRFLELLQAGATPTSSAQRSNSLRRNCANFLPAWTMPPVCSDDDEGLGEALADDDEKGDEV